MRSRRIPRTPTQFWRRPPHRLGLLLTLLLLPCHLVAAGCGRVETLPAEELPKELRPLPSSLVERSARFPHGHVVSYRIEEPFPADRAISSIESQIGGEWRPLDHLRRNPTIQSSRLRGWTGYLDGLSRQGTFVHQWWSEWEDANGNLLTYVLEYRSPAPSANFGFSLERPTVSVLRVEASIESAEILPRE